MSSALMASTTCTASRLMVSAERRLWRRPVTSTTAVAPRIGSDTGGVTVSAVSSWPDCPSAGAACADSSMMAAQIGLMFDRFMPVSCCDGRGASLVPSPAPTVAAGLGP